MDGSAIDEQINLRRCWPIHRRQTNHPLQPDLVTFRVDDGCLASKGATNYCRETVLASRVFRRLITHVNQCCAGVHIEKGTAIIDQLESNSRPGHGKPPHNIEALSLLGAVSLQKFKPRRHRFEQLCYRNQTARLQCSRFRAIDPADIDLQTPGVRHASHYRSQFQMRHCPD